MSDTLLDSATAPVGTEQPTSHDSPAPASSDWRAAIPAEYAREPFWNTNLKDKGLGDVLKTTIEAQKKLGGAIFLPSEKDKPEDRAKKIAEIYGKLGRPESPDKYTVNQPPLPEGAEWEPQRETSFKTAAHALNLTGAQVQGVLDWYGKEIAQSVEQQGQRGKDALRDAHAALKADWGGAYESNLGLAGKAMKHLAQEARITPDDSAAFVEELKTTGMGNNTVLLKLLATMGAYLSNDKLITGESSASSEESIDTQIRDLMNKPEYTNKQDPGYDAINAKVLALFEQKTNAMRKALQEG